MLNFARLGTRLVLVLALMLTGFLVVAATVWVQLNAMTADVQETGDKRVPQVLLMADLRTETARIQSLARQSLLDSTPQQVQATKASIAQAFATLQDGLNTFERHIFSDKARQQVADLRTHLGNYRSEMGKLESLLLAGDREAALAQLQTVGTVREPLLKVLHEANDWQKQILKERTQALRDDSQFLQAELVVMALLLLTVSVVASVWLMRQLNGRLREASSVAHRIASNDLAEPVRVTGNDEFTALLREMAAMRDALHSVVAAAREASDNIQVAASEVATGNQDLANRTEATASNLEETASSMEQITATVKQSADAAAQANQLASTATDVAQRGGQVVHQVVATMDDINASSKKIADIIGVIDGIAFQTNILALNAAVEAARAGEQGRGFAVVAGEVRSLAQRSAQAAKEIKGLIQTSVEKVESGSELVKDAGATMGDIVSSVQRVTDVMGEITAAAAEQSNGIAQVNAAVSQLDQMTQQNAALVEQSTAAAQSLREQAIKLAEVVSVFKLGTGVGTPPAPTRRAQAPAAPTRVTPPPAPRPSPRPATAATVPATALKPPKTIATPAIAARPIGQKSTEKTTPPLRRPSLGQSPAAGAPAASAGVKVSKPQDEGEWESF